jgi:hypothetical protein
LEQHDHGDHGSDKDEGECCDDDAGARGVGEELCECDADGGRESCSWQLTKFHMSRISSFFFSSHCLSATTQAAPTTAK